MEVSALLLKGPSFDERHVYWMDRQLKQNWPGVTFRPYSNVPLDIPHVRIDADYRTAWWGKMEIAKLGIAEPTLLLDLDTVVLGPVQLDETKPSLLRHLHYPEQPMCGVMLWTPEFAKRLAAHYFERPRWYRAEANNDDQRYFRRYWLSEMAWLQDYDPDAYASFKCTVVPHGLRPSVKIVYFHGQPRPWDVAPRPDWIPSLT